MYRLDRKTRRNLVRAQARRLGIPMRDLWRMHQTGDYSALLPKQRAPRWYDSMTAKILGGVLLVTVLARVIVTISMGRM